MKKIISLALLLAVSATYANAQFYFRLGAGYALPSAGQTLGEDNMPYSGTSSSNMAFTIKSASFSSGLNGTIGLGYMFTEHIGAQLDAGVGLANTKYKFTEQGVKVNNVLSDVDIEEQAANPFILTPSLVLQTGGKVWNVYCRMGPAIPLRTTVNQDITVVNEPGTGVRTVTEEQVQISSNFSLGYSAATGLTYKVNDRLSIWGEISILSLSAYVKQETLTAFIYNGQNVPLSQLGTNPQTYYYSKTGTVNSIHSFTYSQPFSNASFTFGVKFNLSEPAHSATAIRPEDDF